MVNAYRQTVTVQPGGRIEFASSELPAGAEAEVIVLIAPRPSGRRFTDFIGAGRGLYESIEDANKALRAERDAWEP